MKRPAWILAVGVAAALVACHLQRGEASLTFEGEPAGEFTGGGVTCPYVGSVSGAWSWTGEVDGRQMSVGAYALNASGVPDTLLIHRDGLSFQGRRAFVDEEPFEGEFKARLDHHDKTLLHIEGSAFRDGYEPITVRGALRCPCDTPPCSR